MKLLIVISCLALAGCANTVRPERVTSAEASFDGNEQNSGILSVSAAGALVTDHFRNRYNSLIDIYGRDFTPALRFDQGVLSVTKGRWLIDRQHLSQFLEMNAWHRAGLKPKN